MGSCLSKKPSICSSSTALPDPPDQTKTKPQVSHNTKPEEETVKKEIFIIKHQKSPDIDDPSSSEDKTRADPKPTCQTTINSTITTKSEPSEVSNNGGGLPNVVRTSSCTKEEVDAILIQCGRLSRSSSTGKANSGGRKYSGSKRSYDFDQENSNSDKDQRKGNNNVVIDGGDDERAVVERVHRHRHRQSSPSSSTSRRRRTPSRERDLQQQQRSDSRERAGGSGGGRRVSRSPGRRSDSPINCGNGSGGGGGGVGRPGKMVSVPASVSSMGMDKSNIGSGMEQPSVAAIKHISAKRNSRSPARANVRAAANENQNAYQQQPLSLSRSNSRKGEHSPYRRNPLGEIDQNCVGVEVPLPSNKTANNVMSSQAAVKKSNVENIRSNNKTTIQETPENKVGSSNFRTKDVQYMEEAKVPQRMTSNVAVTVVASEGAEKLIPQTITRSRSSRLSRDLDLNLNLNPDDTLLNPSPSSYTALLLEDIQNFHQKSAPAISLPPCVTKACSILEAVADLNSSTSSNLSVAVCDDRKISPTVEQFNKKEDYVAFGANHVGKKRLETKDPFVESEVLVSDDLMEPSFHKYVTVRRGTVGGVEMEEQESSGSNSFVSGQQQWVSSLWEPNSADSTDCWTSMPNTGEDGARRSLSEKKRESDHQQIGIGRGRIGSGRGLHSTPTLAAAST